MKKLRTIGDSLAQNIAGAQAQNGNQATLPYEEFQKSRQNLDLLINQVIWKYV